MRYKVGDKVVIRKGLVGGDTYGETWFAPAMEKYCGETLIVREIRDYVSYRCSTESNCGDMWNYNDSMINHKATKALNEKPKFKVGDIVRGTKAGDERYSITNSSVIKAEVMSVIKDNHDDIGIKIIENGTSYYKDIVFPVESKYFELVEAKCETFEESAEKPKFKVGDKVKVVKNSRHDAPKECTGRTGEITDIDGSTPDICVQFESDIDYSDHWYFSEDELELVKVEVPKFTKADLKDRYIVTFRDGEYGMVDGDKIRIIRGGEFVNHMTYDVSDLRENLTDIDDADFCDIIAVHKPEYKTIWERTDTVKEMTLSDIEKALGYKVKVVK